MNQHGRTDNGIHFTKIGIILITFINLLLVGCNKSVVESPNNNINIWGFGNNNQVSDNTYKDKNATIAQEGTYTYYNAAEFQTLVQENSNQDSGDIYSSSYQTAAREQLELLKQSKTYTIDNPLLIHNPFGTNAGGLYVYVGTPSLKVNLYYKVSIEDINIPDYSATMYINRTTSTGVEGQVIGLIGGTTNKVILEIRDVDGTRINKKAYYLDIPVNTSNNAVKLSAEFSEKITVTRGLFSFLAKEEDASYYIFYDNKGILRAEIPTRTDNAKAKLLQVENQIFLEYDRNRFIMLDNLGNMTGAYDWMEEMHLIDYDYDDINQTIIFLEDGNNDSSQRIISLDLVKNEWKELFSLGKLMPEAHEFVSIQSANGKDLLVCTKEYSTIVRVNNVYYYPVIRWMIGREDVWKDTEYESLLLFETQNKTIISGIDSLTYITNKKLKEGQCYLAFINYNAGNNEEINSNVMKYLVDENQNRYRMVMKIEFPKHSKDCSVMVYGNHTILSLGQEKQFIEYDEKGEMMLRFTIPNINSSYQVIKYIMDRYWF